MSTARNDKTLLFLEDDRDLQALVCTFLRDRGYQVTPARTAAEAREVLQSKPVDAAIVDGLLPGMTGADFIRELRKTKPDLPVLFASAFWKDLKSHELLTRQLGVARVVHKPYRPEELAVWLEQLFAVAPPPPPPQESQDEEDAEPVDDFAASLALLSADYGAKLPERLATLQALLGKGRHGDAAAMEEAYSVVHKLHGTAGSYGFRDVSITAGALEDVLRPVKTGGTLDWARVDAGFRALEDRVSLPVLAPEPEQAVVAAMGTLLVVDEDAAVLADARRMGEREGVRVVTASTPQEACAAVEKQWVDGALLHMGGAGLATASALRAMEGHQSLPLAFSSTSGGLQERVNAAHAGASLFLPRPFTQQDFATAAERLVATRRLERAKVMVVDDDPEAVRALSQALVSDAVEVVGLENAYGLLDALAQHRPDLLLLDVQMPGPSGFDLCRILRLTPEWQELPILLITAQVGLEFRLAAFQAGADDYLAKPVLKEELRARVHARLERARLSRERTERDALTGLMLRRPFVEAVATRLSEARRSEKPLALCFLDVDHFKKVNDQHGHLAGDRVLMRLGRLLGARFRREDLRARWGGEEFVVALLGETPESAKEILSRTAEELSAMTFEGDTGDTFHVTFSAGLAVAPGDGTTLDELLRVADARLYRAKENGRNRIETE
ncbi:response regulator/GGDEF domain-containing protein [Corallococcus coralloides DSM 2259]|uniref:diguanylate cyclase n=1 Tax=Corallococcus coralloides (strain ATCC 25202 / DSM 2259 / NBRC 100086 / M2) TaxID=1144275 RepID=H8MXY0_CORCM|nr:response regulator [Corallococcus coralloides]AFE09926.1 response regulator/GGDEF domain-containing protein [Corallococcus coralloides DSM 2259]